jgi:hypothetical protein
MKLGVFAVLGILFLLVAAPPGAVSQEAGKASKLQVHLNYSGSGTVDEKHKIYVVLWDSPDFVAGGAMPVELQPSTSKDGIVTFSDVKTSPAYVSAAFDPKGEWDAQSGPPPEGSSLGLYSKTPGKPEPIDLKPGKTVSIELSFDDSVKMRSGKPTR